jgi:hypothetical protein
MRKHLLIRNAVFGPHMIYALRGTEIGDAASGRDPRATKKNNISSISHNLPDTG